MQTYMFLAIAIIGEVIGTSALKASQGFTQLVPSIIVIAGYGVAFFFLSLTLRTFPVGLAYAIWSGAGIVLVSAAGWIIYGQKIDFWGFVGLSLIVAGVLIVNLISKSAAH
jgi:multidrug transporter EmrE-like cation transporter